MWLVAGGEPGTGAVSIVEEYNGSSWTTVTSLPLTAKNHAASGTQTDGLVYSGTLGVSTSGTTLGYDGTNWSTRPSMASGRRQGASFVRKLLHQLQQCLEDPLIIQGGRQQKILLEKQQQVM